MTNSINLGGLNANTVLASTFSQAVYPNAGGASFVHPAGFQAVTIAPRDFIATWHGAAGMFMQTAVSTREHTNRRFRL